MVLNTISSSSLGSSNLFSEIDSQNIFLILNKYKAFFLVIIIAIFIVLGYFFRIFKMKNTKKKMKGG